MALNGMGKVSYELDNNRNVVNTTGNWGSDSII